MKQTRYLYAALGVLTALYMPLRAAAQPKYVVTDLGTLGGTSSSSGGINSKGHAEGISTLAGGESRGFLWRNGVMLDLGTLGGPNSNAAWQPNNSDEVGGASETNVPDPNGEDVCAFGTHLICLPFRWQNGKMRALPLLGGNNGLAAEVNNSGQIAGVSEVATADPTCVSPQVLGYKPVIWTNGQIQELPTYSGDSAGNALVINDRGDVAGVSSNCAATSAWHALLWVNGAAINLGNLGGTLNNIPQDINNANEVVGGSDLAGDTIQHAFIWHNGIMTDMGTLPGYPNGFAVGINQRGQVVGAACDGLGLSGNCRAFFWENGVMTDLNALIPGGSNLFLTVAASINEKGQIAGTGMDATTGQMHAFVATPCGSSCGGMLANVPPGGIVTTHGSGLRLRRWGR